MSGIFEFLHVDDKSEFSQVFDSDILDRIMHISILCRPFSRNVTYSFAKSEYGDKAVSYYSGYTDEPSKVKNVLDACKAKFLQPFGDDDWKSICSSIGSKNCGV